MKYNFEILPGTENPLFHERENSITHSPFSLELKLYRALGRGDADTLKDAIENYIDSGFVIGRMSTNSLREMKFWAVSVIAVAVHYAILGGLDETDAYNLSDEYIRHIDSLHSLVDALDYMKEKAVELTEKVRKSEKNLSLSPLLKSCIHYIHIHLHERITLKDLALSLGISPGYLSHLFSKETGMTLSSYIMDRKLEESLSMLERGLDYETVSYNLSFSSQSHFIQCFRKKYGTTPRIYLKRLRC